MDNKLKIINYLGKNMGESFTMNELSKAIKMPYATFYRTVQGMSDILIIKSVGKSKTLTVDVNNPSIISYLSISSEEEKKDYLRKQPVIKKISEEITKGS
jgi:hypothetical protein